MYGGPLHVALDIDGVFADFNREICERITAKFNIPTPEGHALEWGWSSWISGLTDKMEKEVVDQFYAEGAWDRLHSYHEAEAEYERLNELFADHQFSFITSRPRRAHKDTVNWLISNGFTFARNVFHAEAGDRKGETARFLGVHIALDDYGPAVLNYQDNGIVGVLLSRPYNKGYEKLVEARGGLVVATIEEFVDHLMQKHVVQDEVMDEGPTVLPAYSMANQNGENMTPISEQAAE